MTGQGTDSTMNNEALERAIKAAAKAGIKGQPNIDMYWRVVITAAVAAYLGQDNTN
jgi:hypothetical protein